MFNKKWFSVVAIILYHVNSKRITNCNDIITPDKEDTVICDNTCMNCNIICDNTAKCDKLMVYSGANNTRIECSKIDACKDSMIFIGDTGNYPNNYNSNNFNGIQNYTEIICSDKAACNSMNIEISGYFEYGGLVNIIGNQDDIFKDSTLEVNIQTGNDMYFNLDCGQSSTSCGNVAYTCGTANCECDGEIDNLNGICSSIFDNQMTRNPTQTSMSLCL